MKEGNKPLIFHTMHMAMVFLVMAIILVFGYCLGDPDDGEKYIFFYSHGEYTLLYQFYVLPIMIYIFLLAFLGSLHPVPYGILYWIKFRRNPELGNARKGMIATVLTLLLIIAHPFGTVYLSDKIYEYRESLPVFSWLVIILFIIVTTNIVPYSFIRLSYTQLTHLRMYKVYCLFFASQLIIYLLLISFSLGAFPEMRDALKTYIDSRYSRW